MSLDSFMSSHGYRYTTTEGHGPVHRVYTEYNVYLHVVVKAKGVFGIQTDKKSKWYYLGDLKSFDTTKHTTRYNTVRLVQKASNANEMFTDSDAPLGGKKEMLGWHNG